MAHRQSNEAIERLNRGLEESRQAAQHQTMGLARDYFTDSVDSLKRQVRESRARLDSLPEELSGGQDESFQRLFGQLMDAHARLENCLDEAQRSAAGMDLQRLRGRGGGYEATRLRQGDPGTALAEPEETDAAHREARRRGVDLDEVDGTGTAGRVVAEDVRSDEERQTGRPEATDAAHREARERGIDLSEVEATGAEGQIIISDVVEFAESADRNTADAGTAASTTAGSITAASSAGESATEGTSVGEDISGDASGENIPDLAEHAAEVANRAASDRSADRGREEAVPDLQSQLPNDRAAGPAGGAMEGAGTRSARETAESVSKEEPRATEAARRKADARGIELSDVEGTGSGGQITVADVTGVPEDDKGAVGQAPRQTSTVPRGGTGRTADGETDRAQEASRQTDVSGEPLATNAARSRAEKLGVDLSRVKGSGANGLITLKDVRGAQSHG